VLNKKRRGHSLRSIRLSSINLLAICEKSAIVDNYASYARMLCRRSTRDYIRCTNQFRAFFVKLEIYLQRKAFDKVTSVIFDELGSFFEQLANPTARSLNFSAWPGCRLSLRLKFSSRGLSYQFLQVLSLHFHQERNKSFQRRSFLGRVKNAALLSEYIPYQRQPCIHRFVEVMLLFPPVFSTVF